jgi:hypothetical protein
MTTAPTHSIKTFKLIESLPSATALALPQIERVGLDWML